MLWQKFLCLLVSLTVAYCLELKNSMSHEYEDFYGVTFYYYTYH